MCFYFMPKTIKKKPELTLKAIRSKDKEREAEKKKKKKKSEEDEKFDDAYDELLEYHKGYTVDDNMSPFCEED